MPKSDATLRSPPGPSGDAGPLVVWLAIQLVALLLAALKMRYSVNFPKPEERMALEEMLVAQIAAAAMLFPILLRNARTAAIVVIASWPFTVLAGLMSAQINPWKIVGPAAVVSAWLGGLAIWLLILRTQWLRLTGVAVATGLALGGPLLWYLRAEFVERGGAVIWNRDARLGPVMAALGLCDGGPRNAASWQFMASFVLFTGTIWLIASGISHHRRSTSSSDPHS